VRLIKPEEFSTLTEGTKAILIKTVINSIEILHRSHIVHCDLKPDNVLIHKTATENLVSKVIDLDGAFFEDDVPDPDDMQFDQQYMAPEILLYNQKDVSKKVNLSTAADVFSLGLIFFEFWTGIRVQYDRGRFGDPASTLIEGGKLSWDRSRVPTVLGDTIEAMLNLEPAVRPSIIQVGKRLSTLGLSKPAMGVEGSDRTLASSPSPSTAKVSIRFSKNLVR